MTISAAIEKLSKLDLESALIQTIDETKEDFADLNRAQWAVGQLADGGVIGPPYTKGYAARKSSAGLLADTVNLKMTGAFYQGYGIVIDNDILRLGSEVDYEPYITARYGNIWGLTEENLEKYKEIFAPIFFKYLQEQWQ